MSKNESDENDEHVMHLWQPFKYEVEKDHDYLRNKPAQVFAYRILSNIVRVLFSVICPLFQGLKIEGRENLKKIECRGAVTVMNHVNIIDCIWAGLVFKKRKVYSVTIESNFRIPLVRKIIKALNAVPMSNDPNRLKEMFRAMETALKEGSIVNMYPEGVLIPYYDGPLRKFKSGAFYLACRAESPVLPIVVKYRKGKGLFRLKRKPCITLKILEPVESRGKMEAELMQECREIMEAEILRS